MVLFRYFFLKDPISFLPVITFKLSDPFLVENLVGPFHMNIESEWLKGEAGKEILSYARNNKIDLIVMGAFGRSRIHDLILGGTTAYIIRESTIPILLNR